MADISKYIRDLYKDSAELSDLVGILQELVDRIEALEAQQKAAFKLGRNAGLEEAKQVAAAYGPSRPIVTSVPSLSVRGRWEGEQAASIGIAFALESLKDNTP